MLQEIKRWLRPRAVVLMYHRIIGTDNDPWELAVSTENFRQQMTALSREYQVISLQELVAGINRGKFGRRTVVISFDDCYRDNLINAVPVLKSLKLPATFFVPTDLIGMERMFWWDALLQLSEDYGSEWSHLQTLSYSEINKQLEQRGISSVSDNEIDHPMSTDELFTIARDNLFSLGIHTCTHPALGMLSYADQEKELTKSREWLYRNFTSFADVVAYPYGHYNDDTIRVMKNNNFDAGFTTEARNIPANANIYQLGRFQVKNQNGVDFKKQLTQWFLQ